MTRVLTAALVAALVIPFPLRAQGKPDFSGTWTLDQAKSDPAPAGRAGGGGGGGRGAGGGGGRGAGGPVMIKQTATDITIGMNTYKLDGSETTIAGGRGGDAKAKATWDGAKLVITTSRDVQGTAITMKDVRSLSADGKEMTVESTTTGLPQGGGTRKTVYTKS
jgi:hypothetical protein